MLVSVFALTNCTKEIESPILPEQKGEPFELYAATPQTKTVNEGLKTKWAANDKIAVFYGDAIANPKTYSAGQVYICDDVTTGHFQGTLDANKPLAASNNWYAFYSSAIKYDGTLNAGFTTPESSSAIAIGANVHYTNPQSQKQTDLDNMKHIAGTNYPLAGFAKKVAKGKTPELALKHISSLLKIVVTNNSNVPLEVNNIEVETAATPIVGLFNCGFENDALSVTAVPGNGSYGNPNASNIASLDVVKGKEASSTNIIENGQSASFYLAIAPFTAKANEQIKFRVNGYEKTLTLTADMTFPSGGITPIPFNYDQKPKELTAGTYVIAAKDKLGDFYALSSDNQDTGKIRLQDVGIGAIENVTATYETVNDKLLWEVAKTTEGFSVKNGTNYICWDDTNTSKPNNVKLSATEVSLNIVGTLEGFFRVHNIVTDLATARSLAYNAGSGFAFYFNYANPDLYFIPAILSTKTQLAPPTITATATAAADATQNIIEVTWTDDAAASSYVVSCGDLLSQTINQGEQKAEFTGMPYGRYLITIQAIAANPKTHLDSPVSAEVEAILEDPASAANIKLTFPNDTFDKSSNYTSTWHGTTDGHTWEFYGFNNNNNNATWTNVRAGRKYSVDKKDKNKITPNPTDPYIATDLIEEKISEVKVTVKKAGKSVTKANLIIASDNTFKTNVKEIALTPKADLMIYSIPAANQAPNQYYKLQYHETGATKNTGELRVEKVELVVVTK